jgi:hypothetical protein
MLGSVLVFQEYFIKKSVNKDHSTLFSVTTTKLYVSFKEICMIVDSKELSYLPSYTIFDCISDTKLHSSKSKSINNDFGEMLSDFYKP